MKNLEQVTTNILKEFGAKAANKGYAYLREAIIITVENPKAASCIIKEIYGTIAEKHSDTISKVERSIRHSIETCRNLIGSEISFKVFGNSLDPNKFKVKNSEFIAAVADYIKINGLADKDAV
jgi:two-component system response regulator (stage 0 sporulation protein A)